MQRCFTNILTQDVAATADFYQDLLELTPKFSSDWFVNLAHPENPGIELGILKTTSEIVPAEAQEPPAGVILTFVVEDCDTVHQRARASQAEVVEAPRDMPYGQRRMILKDPAGTFVDISSLT